MRPYNTYRNPEVSQPVSSVANTLADKTLNSSEPFEILRSLSESISVDCGSFEISAPTECYQTSSVPLAELSEPNDKAIQTPVESVSPTPVNAEPAKARTPVKSSVNAVADLNNDNFDCMSDPDYQGQCVKETDSPSFEELMARTVEGIAKMREEIRSAYANSKNDEMRDKSSGADSSDTLKPQVRTESVENASKSKIKSSTNSQAEPLAKKSALSSIRWDKTRKLLFSRETIKLTLLSIAVSALIVSAVIYKNSARRNNGLPESEDVVMNQSAPEIQSVPVQKNVANLNIGEFNNQANDNYWNSQKNDSWASSDDSNPRGALTDQMRGDYLAPSFAEQNEYNYSQNDSNGYSNQEDAGRLLAPPHNSNSEKQLVNSAPVYNVEPKYAEISPAFGSQYNPDEYESPILEDDTATGEYSETGYNSNFMR